MRQISGRGNTKNGKTLLKIRSVYTVIIALLPVIMIYNVPLVDKGMSTVLLGILTPFALRYILRIRKFSRTLPVLSLFLYMLLRSQEDSENAIVMAVALIHILGIFGGSINVSVMRRTIEKTAVFASILVIIQTISYYVLHIRLQFLIRELVLSANQGALSTSSGTLYRPSAIFLEPSHFAQFATVALMSVLFPQEGGKVNLRRALFIALGCMLTTSGMGIVLCTATFLVYLLFRAHQEKATSRIFKIIGGTAVGVIVFFVLMRFSFFYNAVRRIFGEVDGYNAIWGRTLFWDSTIGQMSGNDLAWGYGSSMLPSKYMTGLMEVIYCYGYVGLGLLGFTILCSGIQNRQNRMSVFLCVAYAGLMTIANLYSFISLTFWLTVIGSEQLIMDRKI